jgi:2-isopropylmalate synthase
VESDIRRAWDALKYGASPRLHVFIAVSDIHLRDKLHLTREQALEAVRESVTLAKSLCGDIQFGCEDASRADPAFLYQVVGAAIACGAGTVTIPDTVGYAMPGEFGALIRGIRENVPGAGAVTIGAHCHDDLGLAVANTLAAVENGARQIETTINGIGERAGNCAMEEAVMALTTRSGLYGVGHSIKTNRIYRTSSRVAKITGVPVAVNKAIVGQNAFSHESGIHQHGVLANPLTYEIMTPQSVGITKNTMVLGKLSGRHAFAGRLQDMGYALTQKDIDSAFAEFKELADKKKVVADDDLEAIVSHALSDVPDYYRLDTFQIQSGNKLQAMALVALAHDGETLTEAATGDGPIDAAFNATVRIVGGKWPLVSYDIKAVTAGMDALGEVIVRVSHGGGVHIGRGLSTDVLEASIIAYINAINRALALEARES